MFDEIVRVVWQQDHGLGTDSWSAPSQDLLHFQELIQNFVAVGESGNKLSRKTRRLGARLRNVRKDIELRQQEFTIAKTSRDLDKGFQNIGSVLGQLTKDTDSADEDDVELGDFIHLSALQEESTEDHSGDDDNKKQDEPLPQAPWKSINPLIVILLASVAFSAVLALVTGTKATQIHFWSIVL